MGTVEEFMRTCFDSSSADESDSAKQKNLKTIGKKKKKKSESKIASGSKKVSKVKETTPIPDNKSLVKITTKTKKPKTPKEKEARKAEYKESLNRLLAKDPSFKDFLKEHDSDLLNFEPSSSSEEEGEELSDEEEESRIDKAGEEEEEDISSESGSEEGGEEEESKETRDDAPSSVSGDPRRLLTLHTIKEWDSSLRKQPSFAVMRSAIQGFRAAVERSGADVESESYLVEDRACFNAVVRLCFTTLEGAMIKLLNLDSVAIGQKPAFFASKGHHKWKRYKNDIRMYLEDLIKLLGELQERDVVGVTLKHMGKLEILYAAFPRIAKNAMKVFVKIWSQKDESCRVLAILNINRLLRRDTDLLDSAIKKSFGEVCALDPEAAYRHAFVYIRQLAIHLRNAMISKKKELVEGVYNWQFVQCLYLWASVLRRLREEEGLRDMVYPLVQVLIGTIKLIPSAKYYPLRFHCCRILIQLAKSASIYIPVIPEIIEPLSNRNIFNKRHTKRSSKPLNFDCCLKLSKSQMEENGFKDSLIQAVYELVIEATKSEMGSLAFPEMTMPCLALLKSFCKKCKVGNYARQMKSLADTITEHGKFVTEFRKRRDVNLADPRLMEGLEVELNLAESPLKKFYSSWKKMRAREKQIQTLADKGEREIEQDHDSDEEDEVPRELKEEKQEVVRKRKPEKKVFDKEEKPPKKKKAKMDSEILLPNYEDLVQDLELSD